jgi:poly-gamma-glutamate capsule biosynthesis protein CapA/YwtB (metallophosphatase superfamily)
VLGGPRQAPGTIQPWHSVVAALIGTLVFVTPLPAAAAKSAAGSDEPACQPAYADPLPNDLPTEVTLCFTGDNLLGARMPRMIEQLGDAWPYGAVVGVLNAADLAFGNLECPITDSAVRTPGKSWESIQQGHNFIFKAPPESSGRILREAGFDVVSLANNHIMDYCGAGLMDTLAELDEVGIVGVGAGGDLEQAFSSRVLSSNGLRIGFLARSVIVPPASKAGASAAGLAWQGSKYEETLGAAIRELRARADIVIVSFHWGIEGQRRHAAYQQQLARRCIDDGALLVIGHHPHCLQGIEFYNGGLIAYSLGNFLFTGKSPLIESAILRVSAGRGGIRQVELLPCWVRGGRPEPAPADEQLLKRIQEILEPTGVAMAGEGNGWQQLAAATSATQ